MWHCNIKGCRAWISEILAPKAEVDRWIQITAEQWPNLDWYAFGGIDKITLCPQHRASVFDAIIIERGLDPSMNPKGGPEPGNRS